MTNRTTSRDIEAPRPTEPPRRSARATRATPVAVAALAALAAAVLIAGCAALNGAEHTPATRGSEASSSTGSKKGGGTTTPTLPTMPPTPSDPMPPGDTGPDEAAPGATDPLPSLGSVTGGAFGDAFGPSTGSLNGTVTVPGTTAPTETEPPATTTPTVPPTTAPAAPPAPPPTTQPTTQPTIAAGVPVAAFAPSLDRLLTDWNAASQRLAADSTTGIQGVTFVASTFVTTPSLSGSGFTAVGRDTTEEVFVGVHTNASGEVTGLLVGGHADNGRPLSAIAAIWFDRGDDVTALLTAYDATVDADAADITSPAADGGIWSVIDLDTTIVFSKVQNSDATVAADTTSTLLIEVITLLPPLT